MTEVIDRSLERVRRRRNDIRFDVDAVGWQIHGRPAGLSRAVLNLLDNAASGARPAERWHCGCARWMPPAELTVSDQGPGIEPEEQGLVFERFYRSTSARNHAGSGLGLAIVKQVVVKHGGMIRIGRLCPAGSRQHHLPRALTGPSDRFVLPL